jgi:predicted dehydrogenase
LPALVEKPPGVNLNEAERLLKLVPQPWLGFNRRFDPDVVKLKNQCSNHDMSKIRLELCYRRRAWNPIDMQDDALLDLGPHLIDLSRWLTRSEVTSVRARTLTQHYAEFEVELDRYQATIVCCCNSPYRERVSILSKDDRVLGMFRRGGILAGIVGKLFPSGETPLLHSLVGQLEAFRCAVQGLPSAQALGSVGDGVKVMAVIEAVRDSARAGGSNRPVLHSEAMSES